ncbi:MAG: LPS assembly lipoprotein LptE [Lautropia sp.]
MSSCSPAARRAGLAMLGAAALLVPIAGCGFRLRGDTDLHFRTLHSGFAPGSPVGEAFRRQVQRTTTTRLVDRPEDAQVRLQVLSESREKDIVAYSAVGRPRQYELRLRLRFRAHDGEGREFIAPSEIVLRRDIGAADNQLTARVDEEALLYRDMQADMVQQLIGRLATIRPETAGR